MSNKNGTVLSLSDFVAAAERVETRYIDLTDVGMPAGVYIRQMSGTKRRKAQRLQGKMRAYPDGSIEFDARSLPDNAEAELIKMSVVTDDSGANFMFDAGSDRKLQREYDAMLADLPGDVTNRLIAEIRSFNGLTDDSRSAAKND